MSPRRFLRLLPAGPNAEAQYSAIGFEQASELVTEIINRAPELARVSSGAEVWQQRAFCRDPHHLINNHIMYPPTEAEESPEQNLRRLEVAKALCAVCPVEKKCLETAMARNERRGVRGGMSESQRRRLAKSLTKDRALAIEASKRKHPSNYSEDGAGEGNSSDLSGGV